MSVGEYPGADLTLQTHQGFFHMHALTGAGGSRRTACRMLSHPAHTPGNLLAAPPPCLPFLLQRHVSCNASSSCTSVPSDTAPHIHSTICLPACRFPACLLPFSPQSIELLYLRAICHHALGYVRKAVADYEACMHVPARPKEDGPLAEEAQ